MSHHHTSTALRSSAYTHRAYTYKAYTHKAFTYRAYTYKAYTHKAYTHKAFTYRAYTQTQTQTQTLTQTQTQTHLDEAVRGDIPVLVVRLCHIIIHTMSHHPTYYVTSSYRHTWMRPFVEISQYLYDDVT